MEELLKKLHTGACETLLGLSQVRLPLLISALPVSFSKTTELTHLLTNQNHWQTLPGLYHSIPASRRKPSNEAQENECKRSPVGGSAEPKDKITQAMSLPVGR